MPCNVEKANEKIFVHALHASKKHALKMIKTVDSDIVVTAIANFHQLVSLNELWIEFGARKLLRIIPNYQIVGSLGPDKSLAFLFFHAFSGCDAMYPWMGLLHYLKTYLLFQHVTKSVVMNSNCLSSLW